LRARIGALACGVPLPSVADIRAELGVGQATVEKALALLESQGLVERKRRKGVFVADRLATGEIAIVLSQATLGPNASPTYARVCSLLRQELHEFNPKWAVKLHLGMSSVPGPDMPATLDLLEPTVLPRLRGVLSFHPLYEVEKELAAAGVPVIYLSAAGPARGTGVFMDREQMLRDGVRHLAESGCRSVALLHSRYVGRKYLGSGDPVPAVAAAAADCGLEFRDESIDHAEGGWTERHGYDLFMRMWDTSKRPDGIMVADDILCHGVLRAILERQVELPRQLRLVTQANHGFDFPYPRPVTRVEFDLDAWTDKALRMLESLAKGQPLKKTAEWVEATLVKGETT
jgi:DNA-binding LacI/PurR family transcriptional regulator